jgi:hypothetical protein
MSVPSSQLISLPRIADARGKDGSVLARCFTIDKYCEGELFRNLERRRTEIKKYGNERYSRVKVATLTTTVHSNLISVLRLQ